MILDILQDGRTNPSVDEGYCLSRASNNGDIEIVRMLLNDPRVDPNATRGYALVRAVVNDHLDVVKLLLSHSEVYPNILREAIMHNKVDAMRLLLSEEGTHRPEDMLDLAYQQESPEMIEVVENYYHTHRRSGDSS